MLKKHIISKSRSHFTLKKKEHKNWFNMHLFDFRVKLDLDMILTVFLKLTLNSLQYIHLYAT